MKRRLYPFIDGNGVFFEIYLDVRRQVFERAIYPKISTAIFEPGDAPMEVQVRKEMFRRQEFGFSIGPRFAMTWVFISTAFAAQIKDEERRKAFISDYVTKNAAWLFTYGERKDIPFGS